VAVVAHLDPLVAVKAEPAPDRRVVDRAPDFSPASPVRAEAQTVFAAPAARGTVVRGHGNADGRGQAEDR
jgi:hypothetical protein